MSQDTKFIPDQRTRDFIQLVGNAFEAYRLQIAQDNGMFAALDPQPYIQEHTSKVESLLNQYFPVEHNDKKPEPEPAIWDITEGNLEDARTL